MRKPLCFIMIIFTLVSAISCASPPETTNVPPEPSSNPSPPPASPTRQGPWILPLPPGMAQPRELTPSEWKKVKEIASSDAEVVKQMARDNIREQNQSWVGYAGGSGSWNTAPDFMRSGKWHNNASRFFPAITFAHKVKRGTDKPFRIVGVDLDTAKVVFSSGHGSWELPRKIP